MFIIKYRNVFLSVAAAVVLGAIICLSVLGLRLGIEFKGGTLLEVTYTDVRPETPDIRAALSEVGLSDAVIQQVGETDLSIKSKPLEDAERLALIDTLSLGGEHELVQKSFTSIGPSVGRELSRKAVVAIIFVMLAIIFYVAFAFRSVSKPVSSWKYGLIAIVTLFHDIVATTGVFALLGYFRGAEVNTLFVVALLTVLGVSVSDTIVIFDRVRENLKLSKGASFAENVGKSLSQSFTRSINTSLSTILVLLALFFFGPVTTKDFALVLIVGMFFGTYSSLFVASPLLVLAEKTQKRKK